MSRKPADFSTYKSVLKMSFNQFNRWVASLYGSGYQDGYDEGGKEFGDNPLILDEDSLYDLLLTVPGVGERIANRIVDRFVEECEKQGEKKKC